MFLVVPKPKTGATVPDPIPHPFECPEASNRPVAKVTKGGRVQIACDRCRIKKVKCDGNRPCLRCGQDEAPCIATKKAHTDSRDMMRGYVRSLESQQTRLIRALEKVHRHSRQAVDQEAMKEIVAIVRSCDYDFTAEDPGPTLGKPEKAANLLESHVSGPNGITAREQVDLKAVLEDSDFSQTNVDTSAHSAPQKKRKLGFESSEYIASGLESTGSQDVFGPSSHEQDQPQTPSSANADTATCLAQYDERQGIQSIWAEVGKPNGQSVHIDPIPDADFGFPRDTTMFDTYNSSSYEPQISFLDTLDGCSPTLSYLDPDTQFTDLNGFNPSFADTSIMADTVNRQTMTDLDSQIWWDPSILFHTTIGDVGSQDSASELFPDSLNVPMS